MHQVQTLPPISLMFILILSAHILLGFPNKILYAFLIPPMHAMCAAHMNLFYLITLIIFSEEHNL